MPASGMLMIRFMLVETSKNVSTNLTQASISKKGSIEKFWFNLE